jgi:mannose/fructose/N-acetylgalactosamine-specific phosphotransferase system component IIC
MDLFLISLFGGLLILDTTAVLQILISQPLVSGTLLGWMLGDVSLGLRLGILLQLLWLNQLPVGGAKVPEGNLAAVVAVILVFMTKQWLNLYPNILIVGVVLYALGVSFLGTKLITLIRNRNILFLEKAIAGLETGKVAILGKMTFIALLVHFVWLVAAVLISVWVGQVVFESLLPSVPLQWEHAARFVEYAIMGSGVGLTLNLYKEKYIQLHIILGMGIGILILAFL